MLTISQVVGKFPQEVLERYDFKQAIYTGALAPIEGVVCPKHGVFKQYAAQFRKPGGAGCPSCGHENRLVSLTTPAEEYLAKVTRIHEGKYSYANTVFTKMNAKILVTCPKHGEFHISANHHYYRKQGCWACENEAKKTRILDYRYLSSKSKLANSAETFFLRCMERHQGKYVYPPQEYLGSKFKIRVVCPIHGEFEQAAWDHLSGRGCSVCGAYTPLWELELRRVLEHAGFTVQLSAPVLNGREIDAFIPSRNFGVELHGLHWHTERTRHKEYHREKWEEAQKQGIRLVQVFEDEWRDKRDIVISRLEAMLGKGPKYDARKCDVSPTSFAEAKVFLERTHIQGCGTASLYYGLSFQGELIAVASFGKARTGGMTGAMDENSWEVIRYASTGRVRGGFSRLLKRFLQDVSPTSIISYCDLRYGDGALYASTGFKLDSITPPDYWWVPNGKIKRIPRYTTQKHKIPTHPVLKGFYSPEKTELQVCQDAGWQRIFGVGHQKWVWKPLAPEPRRC